MCTMGSKFAEEMIALSMKQPTEVIVKGRTNDNREIRIILPVLEGQKVFCELKPGFNHSETICGIQFQYNGVRYLYGEKEGD